MNRENTVWGVLVGVTFAGILVCAVAGCPGKSARQSAKKDDGPPDKAPRGQSAGNEQSHSAAENTPDGSQANQKQGNLEQQSDVHQSRDSGQAAGNEGKHGSNDKPAVAEVQPAVTKSTHQPHEKGSHQPDGGKHPESTNQAGSDGEHERRPPLAKVLQSWKKPAFAFVVTGRQHGYIEPCGCQGLENQKGGLARRFTLIRELRTMGWNVLPVDAGNQVRRFGKQAEIKLQITIKALRKMGYVAVAIGPDDARLPGGELFAIMANEEGNKRTFVSANAEIFDREYMPATKIISQGDHRIGITAVLGDTYRKGVVNEDVILQPAAQGLKAAWKDLEKGGCNFRVLVSHSTIKESRELAKANPFDLVISTGSFGEPDAPEIIAHSSPSGHKTTLIQVGTKGMFAGIVAVYPGQTPAIRYQAMPLDARFKDAPEMLREMVNYQDELKRRTLAGLQVKSLPHPRGQFVGSAQCGSCHKKAYTAWQDGPHAAATESIADPSERSEIKRHHDPECLSCHVTGWNPQQYFPYASGYLDYERSKALHGNGCENCHGPGKSHVEAERNRANTEPSRLASLRKSMVMTIEQAQKGGCYQCHDTDNSPDYNWDDYWESIIHVGKD